MYLMKYKSKLKREDTIVKEPTQNRYTANRTTGTEVPNLRYRRFRRTDW